MSKFRVLSLGAGVQSTTLALMMAHGELEPADHAIFADTGWEPAQVYKHLDWLCTPGLLPFPVHIVSRGNILENIKVRRDSWGHSFASVPWHIAYPDDTRGMGKRQCSNEYKLEPIVWKIRDLLGIGRHSFIAPASVEVILGISRDEIERMKIPKQQYMFYSYPLIDRGMRRWDCLLWLERRGYPKPAKSSCIGCPYHGNDIWRDMRDNRPDEWAQAVEADQALRLVEGGKMFGREFMHRDCVPLDEAQIDLDDRQLDLFANECEGLCGV